jgi:hypothetical protein
MAERKKLRLREPTSGGFKPGNKAAKGRGYPTERRLTNRFFLETLFREMTKLDEKAQVPRFERLILCAYGEAVQPGNGALAEKLLAHVLNRFLGAPTQPIAWADLTPERRPPADTPTKMIEQQITPGMPAAEAYRRYSDMLRRDDRRGR